MAASAACCLPAPQAESVCFSAPISSGFSWGPTTLGTNTLTNADTLTSAEICAPPTANTLPLKSDIMDGSGAALSVTSAGVNGLFNSAGVLVAGGPSVGPGRSTSGSNLELLFRVNTLTGYAGGGVEMIDYAAPTERSGSGTASGPGSGFGGTYDLDIGVRPFGGLGTTLVLGGGAAVSTLNSQLFTGSTPVTVDTDYILSISHLIQVLATSGFDGNSFGNSSVSSRLKTTYQLGLPVGSENLELEFPMVDALGVSAPALNGPVPVPLPAPIVLLVTALGWMLSRSSNL
ncbi:MAG: hypothetical protein AAF387_09820 [Pseudomonadota bacterium]